MKKTKVLNNILSILLTVLLTVSVGQIGVYAEAQQIKVNEISGENLPLHRLTGLPDMTIGGDTIGFDGVYTDLGGEFTTVICGQDDSYQDFAAASKDGTAFITVYPEKAEIKNLPNDIRSRYFFSGSEPIYSNGWYYLEMSGYTKSGYSIDFYIKSTDFVNWFYSESDGSEIVLPDYASYLGEYNGFYIANPNNGSPTVIVSKDGKNWEEAVTPVLNYEELDSSDQLFDCQMKIMITSVGVIFYGDMWNDIRALTVCTSFSDYYITKDFKTYKKIDMSALGSCRGKLSADKKSGYYDDLSLVTAHSDKAPIFYRMHGEIAEGKEENNYENKILTNKTEIYTLDERSMKLVPDSSFSETKSVTYAFFTKNQYVWNSQNIDGSNSLYIKEGNAFTEYSSDKLNLANMDFFYHISGDNYPNGVKEDGTADVEFIVGSTDDSLIFSKNLLRTVYCFPMKASDNEDWRYIHWSGDGRSFYLQKTSGDFDTGELKKEYYWVSVDELLEYIYSDILLGDVDGNGETDDWDSVLLDRYLAGWDVEIDTSVADMDKSGDVDDWDSVLLARKLAGWDV